MNNSRPVRAPVIPPMDSAKELKQQLLMDTVTALMEAGPEINDDGRNQGALWALYGCLFGILEYLGADGLPQEESEGKPRIVCSLCRGACEVNGTEPGGPSVPCPLCEGHLRNLELMDCG